jgi:hypothetical protein
VTNTHWYLWLYLIAVVISDAPRTPIWRAHDWLALIIGGLSGPGVIFILPCLVLRYVAQRTTAAARPLFVLAAAALAVVQLAMLGLSIAAQPGRAAFGGDPLALAGVLSSRILLGFLTPSRWVPALSMPAVAIPVALLGLAIAVAVAIRPDWRGRSLVLVIALVLLAAVYTPAFSQFRAQWSPLLSPDEPGYFVVTSLAWAGTLLFFAARYLPRLSNLSLAAVAFLGGFLILFDFALPAVQGPFFGPEADRIAAAAPGTTLEVPIAPPGWSMTLVKR